MANSQLFQSICDCIRNNLFLIRAQEFKIYPAILSPFSMRYKTLSKWPWLDLSWSPLQGTLMYLAVLSGKERRTSPQKRAPNPSLMPHSQIPEGLSHCLYGVNTLQLLKKETSTRSQTVNCATFMGRASQLLNQPQCPQPKNKIWPNLSSRKYKIGFAALKFLMWQ